MRLATFAALVVLTLPAAAQVTETPVPFDSAGRILSVNPSLATRLGLAQPAWPVTGAFVEARLFRLSTGGHSLSVSRPGGSIDRYSLDSTKTEALRTAFAEGIVRAGRVVAEDAANIIAEPARGPFVRDQMILASVIYGPALASLTHDPSIGSGLYLISVGGTFFALNDFARKRAITKSQNSLTTDGAFRGWAAVALTTHMMGAEPSEEAAAMLALLGGIGGSAIGYNRGRALTHSEAQASMTASTLGAGAAFGVAATLGLVEESEKAGSAAVLAGGIAGYALGANYPRRAGYTVTAGDVSVVRLGAILGTMAAITPFVEADDMDPKAAAGIATAGWIGGALIADRIGSKPFNHSTGDARMVGLGALGGGLVGAALPVMAEADNAVFALGSVTAGAILGAIATQRMMDPPRQGSLMRTTESGGNSARVQLQPEGLLLAATGQRGNHTLLRIRF
jgi:hypothetical protein